MILSMYLTGVYAMFFFLLSNPSLSQVHQGPWHFNGSRSLGCKSPPLALALRVISFDLCVAAKEAGEDSMVKAITSSSLLAISCQREKETA